MAKENYVYEIGQVCKLPGIDKDEKGNYTKGTFQLTTLRRAVYDRAGNFSPKWDMPIVMTAVPELCRKLEEIRLYDFLEVKGTVTTKEYRRRTKCPHCGEYTIQNGVMTFINPVYIGIRAHAESRTEGLPYLSQCAEASNIFKGIGRLCRDPSFYQNEEGKDACSYQVAINRKLYVKGSAVDQHTDYPWVKSYGPVAVEDAGALHINSMIYIDGYLRTKKIDQSVVCENSDCLEIYTFPNRVMEIVSLSTEYLQDCELPDPVNVDIDEAREISGENDF